MSERLHDARMPLSYPDGPAHPRRGHRPSPSFASGGVRRRQFLRGAGGAALALPFLPSLLTKAFAAEPPLAGPQRCFFAIATDHGNVWSDNMYPAEGLLTEQTTYAGRTVRHGPLPSLDDGSGRMVLSPVCSAASTRLTPSLVGKCNILRGLDIPYLIGHHTGGYLGNFAGNLFATTGGLDNRAFLAPTIDQVLAWSPSFYSPADLTGRMTRRSIQIGDSKMAWNYTIPAAQAGEVTTLPTQARNIDLYRHVFEPGSSLNGVDAFIVDRVKASYDRLRAHPRLSNGDRLRLDAHLDRVAEIERKMTVVTQLEVPPTAPTEDSDDYRNSLFFQQDPVQNERWCSLMNDIIVAAFASGVTRVGTWWQEVKFANQLINDWHGQVGHQGFGADASQAWQVGWNQGTFEFAMVDLAAKLDTVTAEDGNTLLDHSLLMFVQEAGQFTHQAGCVNIPVVTFGGAGGYFTTGNFVDFTNREVTYNDLADLAAEQPAIRLESPGLYYNQFLSNVLESMGVCPPTGFVDIGSGMPTSGYGLHHIDSEREADYTAARTVMGEKLPVITS